MKRVLAILLTLGTSATALFSIAPTASAQLTGKLLVKYAVDGGLAKCLDAEDDGGGNPQVAGDHIQVYDCLPRANQDWIFEGTTGNWEEIQNADGNLCLDAMYWGEGSSRLPSNNGDPVQLWPCNGGENQQWRLIYDPSNGFYKLQNEYSTIRNHETVLDATYWGAGSSHTPDINGDPVQLWSWNEQSEQLWTINGF